MEKVLITVIGAGVVGLAVALELSKTYQDVFILEKESSFGQGISSRNSEVIHAGIYYPQGSLKAKTCIEGNSLLYTFCKKYNIPHKKTGKLIVAITQDEIKDLEALFQQGKACGAEGLKFISQDEIRMLEPNVTAVSAIYSPSTGIIDTHSFMKSLKDLFQANGGKIAYQTEVTGIDKVENGFKVTVRDLHEGGMTFLSRVVINCAGLDSDKISSLAGLKKDEYRLKYCKGSYFRLHNSRAKFINQLIYPVPKKDRAGLGIHATLDLTGGLRLGPDDEYIDNINYDVDPLKQEIFYQSSHTFLPFIQQDDLSPDTAGIRPKLQGEGEPFRDFIIKGEEENNLEGLINLIGIESPGLTASLAIAGIVNGFIHSRPENLALQERG